MTAPRPHAGAAILLLSLFALPAVGARAQGVRLIVPFHQGYMTDSVARIVVNQIPAGRQFTIENRFGDDGHYGAEVASRAEPDGRTLLFAPLANYAVAASAYKSLHYSFPGDFAGVTLVANAPHVLLAHPSLPAQTVAELIALARARPGRLRWVSHGKISLSQLEIDLFRQLTGVDVEAVPYKESAKALPELLTGNAVLLFDAIAAVLPHVKAGRLRVLAVASGHRSPTLPALPTVAESGVKGFEAEYWYAVLAPSGTGKAVLTRLAGELAATINAKEVRDWMQSYGIEARASAPAEVDRMMRAETAKWAPLARAAAR